MADPGEGRRDNEIEETNDLAVADGSAIRFEGDENLEFIREGKRCCMRFVGADVKSASASVSSIVDGGNKLRFGQQSSDIGNESTSKRIPMGWRKGVFVVQLNAEDVGIQEACVTSDVREFREDQTES